MVEVAWVFGQDIQGPVPNAAGLLVLKITTANLASETKESRIGFLKSPAQ